MLGSRAATESALCACLYECWGGCCNLIRSKTLLVPAALAQEPVAPARIPSDHSHHSIIPGCSYCCGKAFLGGQRMPPNKKDWELEKQAFSSTEHLLDTFLLRIQNIIWSQRICLKQYLHTYWSVMCIVTNQNTSKYIRRPAAVMTTPKSLENKYILISVKSLQYCESMCQKDCQ